MSSWKKLMFLFLIKNKLQLKKILKKDTSIVNEKTISLVFVLMIEDKLLTGINPPDEINVIAKLHESKDLRSKIFNIANIKNVNEIQRINILDDCFKVSDVLKDKKLVKDFFKLLSKISINNIIENKKYKPPIH